MTTLFLTIALIALLMLGMAVGTLANKHLKGSCGGVIGGKDCSCSTAQQKICAQKTPQANPQ